MWQGRLDFWKGGVHFRQGGLDFGQGRESTAVRDLEPKSKLCLGKLFPKRFKAVGHFKVGS